MTAHELAKKLLDGPDLPIVVPKVKEYSDEDEDSCATPTVSNHEGRDPNDEPIEVLVISYSANAIGDSQSPGK